MIYYTYKIYNKGVHTMYEHEIYNPTTGEREIVFNHSRLDPFKGNPQYNPKEWVLLISTYID